MTPLNVVETYERICRRSSPRRIGFSGRKWTPINEARHSVTQSLSEVDRDSAGKHNNSPHQSRDFAERCEQRVHTSIWRCCKLCEAFSRSDESHSPIESRCSRGRVRPLVCEFPIKGPCKTDPDYRWKLRRRDYLKSRLMQVYNVITGKIIHLLMRWSIKFNDSRFQEIKCFSLQEIV